MGISNDGAEATNSNLNSAPDSTPFWNVNVPPHLQTKDCPSYLQYALTNSKDRAILSTPDHLYKRQTWSQVQQLIRDNRLDHFTRVPSQLRAYREYCEKLTREYGSVMEFIVRERLKWEGDLEAKGEMFERWDDIKILPNDWPYGLDTRIKHLVIWTKFSLPSNPITSTDPDGDLTPEARTAINDFVQKHFVKVCGQENVIWFKNWSALKSIHAVEHFHVMVFDEDGRFSGHGGVLGDMAGGDEVFTRLEEGGRG